MKGESAKQATDMLNPTKLWKGSSELMYIIIVKLYRPKCDLYILSPKGWVIIIKIVDKS